MTGKRVTYANKGSKKLTDSKADGGTKNRQTDNETKRDKETATNRTEFTKCHSHIMVYRSLAEGHLTNSKSSEPPQPKLSQTHYVYMIKII